MPRAVSMVVGDCMHDVSDILGTAELRVDSCTHFCAHKRRVGVGKRDIYTTVNAFLSLARTTPRVPHTRHGDRLRATGGTSSPVHRPLSRYKLSTITIQSTSTSSPRARMSRATPSESGNVQKDPGQISLASSHSSPPWDSTPVLVPQRPLPRCTRSRREQSISYCNRPQSTCCRPKEGKAQPK